jgi:hypothetical protein
LVIFFVTSASCLRRLSTLVFSLPIFSFFTAIGRVKTNSIRDKTINMPKCSLNLIGASNNSVKPDTKTITRDEIANHIVIRLNAQAHSTKVKNTVKTNQNQGEKKNL